MQQSWFLKKQFISLLHKYGTSWKLFHLNLGVLWPRCTTMLSKLVKNDKNTGQESMIGIIVLLSLISLLNKKCEPVFHFDTEDNYYCHCHIRFLILITNELNLASDQIPYSYPVSANSWYNTFCIDWRREGTTDLYCIKFRIYLTWKTFVLNYVCASSEQVCFQTNTEINSDGKIP